MLPKQIVISDVNTFVLVLGGYPQAECSTRSNLFARSGRGPFSVLKPFGMKPPVRIPSASAASSPPWSAPVCPPEIIFWRFISGHLKDKSVGRVSGGTLAAHSTGSTTVSDALWGRSSSGQHSCLLEKWWDLAASARKVSYVSHL